MKSSTVPGEPRPAAMFIPAPDVAERREVVVHAPSSVVFEVARQFDLQSIPVIRAIFRLRSLMLRSSVPTAWEKRGGLVDETLRMGWGTLIDEPGRTYAAGALVQPWKADVRFLAVPAAEFKSAALADHVKIVWTIEAEAMGPALTRFSSETRVAAIDDSARTRFRRYWRVFGIGIVFIRWLLLPAIRREAERRHRQRSSPMNRSTSASP